MTSFDQNGLTSAYVLFFKRKNFGDKDLSDIYEKL